IKVLRAVKHAQQQQVAVPAATAAIATAAAAVATAAAPVAGDETAVAASPQSKRRGMAFSSRRRHD
ncbi:hypothetical protein EV177_010106, partial [Coemansia sp. RSA 1804]